VDASPTVAEWQAAGLAFYAARWAADVAEDAADEEAAWEDYLAACDALDALARRAGAEEPEGVHG
jgi:hypothetical protein